MIHTKSAGKYIPFGSSEDGPRFKDFDADTVCWIASCTKLMTSVAAMQCVERGLIRLDDDVAAGPCPELRNKQVLKGFTGGDWKTGEPVFEPAEGTVTLRNLLTHSNGFSYDFMNPTILEWRKYVKRKAGYPEKPSPSSLDVTDWFNVCSSTSRQNFETPVETAAEEAHFKKIR